MPLRGPSNQLWPLRARSNRFNGSKRFNRYSEAEIADFETGTEQSAL
jgi:hypothetical protein